MAIKHKKEKKENKKEEKKEYSLNTDIPPSNDLLSPKMPKEIEEKLAAIKSKLDEFQSKVMKDFEQYILGIALLPPSKKEVHKEEHKEETELENGAKEEKKESSEPSKESSKIEDHINVLVLIDDSDSQKMSKEELKAKLSSIMERIAHEIDEKLKPQTLILSELWAACYDAKYELLQVIASCAPIFDTGMLQAIKIAEIHKTMVLKKFEKYIVSYVFSGSIVKGKAQKTSDIDVWVVIDDTDVKKMTRAELKDKLRAIIIGMGIEAGELTGIKNKLHVQVYILTEFWDSLREANPIILTLLRDCVPFYDRGIFVPWKQLLLMGKIKPSAEAIEMFMETGEQMLKRVEYKIKEIGMEDIYYAILTPSQAALMLYGVPPPAPKETGHLMRELFVKKEKLLEEKYIEILEHNIDIRKKIEHGDKKELSGKDVDELLIGAKDYLERIKKLFLEIEKTKQEENIVNIYDTVITVARDALKSEGIEKAADADLLHDFEHHMITTGKMPAKYLRLMKEIVKSKHDYDAKKLSKIEIEKIRREAAEFVKFTIEYVQRKRVRDIERVKIKIKYGDKIGEIVLLGKTVFIVHDLDHEKRKISKAVLKENGGLDDIKDSTVEAMDVGIAQMQAAERIIVNENMLEDLKKLLGKDIELLLNY